jgi:glucose-6-phosphate isomerase
LHTELHDEGLDHIVLAGMGGSSLAPEVIARTLGKDLTVLDTTDPHQVRAALADEGTLRRTVVVVSSKSGGTVETDSHRRAFHQAFLDLGLSAEEAGRRFVVVTDPGSPLESTARELGARAVFLADPNVGGRYSALTAFGLVPAALLGVNVTELLDEAEATRSSLIEENNPALVLGAAIGSAATAGRDKLVIAEDGTGILGLGDWAEQLLAESTGKHGKGLIPAPGEPADGPDRQAQDVRVTNEYELGQEFFRWEFATAVAGSILGINPFDQPDVQAAKDKTKEVLASGEDPKLEATGSLDELLGGAEPPSYVAIQAFIDPARERDLQPLLDRAHATGCVVTHGLGPRYLHSTGQLHKGGPPTGLFVQVVDDTGEEIPIPGEGFGFGRLIRAQAEGDFRSLQERGRSIVRVRLEDL